MAERELFKNKAFSDQMLTFDGLPHRTGGEERDLGVKIDGEGGVRLRVLAPKADQVRVRYNKSLIALTKGGDGVFEGALPADPSMTGPVTTDIYVDGAPVLCPYIPIYWTGNMPRNFVEIPDDTLDFCALRDVPHGSVNRELFYSAATGSWERCTVYAPPGYWSGTEGDYPVLYLLNGGGDNEMCWEYSGRLSYILDNLLAEGRAEKFLVVMCNGMLREGGRVGGPVDLTFERMLLSDVIPFIESRWRVRTGKWNRAIAGLSMGAYMTCDISLRHPEIFGSVGLFTAGMVHVNFRTAYQRPYANALKGISAEEFGRMFRLYFRSTTPREDHMEFFVADDAIYRYYGYDALPTYHRVVYPETTSKWNSWRMGLRDMACLLFRDTSE